MQNVSKEQLYNWVVEIYKKTGQGLSGIVFHKIGREPLEELLELGLVKVITHHYSYLPKDEWVCLTGVYCVEEEMEKGNGDMRALEFMRKYLGIPRTSGLDRKLDEFLATHPEDQLKYDKWYEEWLIKNKDFIDESFKKVKPMEIPTEPTKYKMNSELAKYIKSTNWYQDNLTVREADNLISRKNTLNNELKMLLTRALQIAPGKKTDKEIEEYTEQLKVIEKELETDKKLHQKFWSCSNTNQTVQEFFSNFDLG
jgi:hypothetical protein